MKKAGKVSGWAVWVVCLPGKQSWLWILTLCSPALRPGAEVEWMVDKQPASAALRAVVHTPQSRSYELGNNGIERKIGSVATVALENLFFYYYFL